MVSKPNMTGIPIQMKLDFESGSGQSFEDVQVHYNSEKPARLGALAYTQGTQVYIGPGQERYLPHELGHVVQQKAGLVRPTRFENGLRFNDDPALERQADHIMEWGGVLPLSPRPEAVIQRAPGPPGVGIELETHDIMMLVATPPKEEKKKDETYWKGQHLRDFDTNGVKWAVTIDTTTFKPERDKWYFPVEIVVDGTTLRLTNNSQDIINVGKDIQDKVKELDTEAVIKGNKGDNGDDDDKGDKLIQGIPVSNAQKRWIWKNAEWTDSTSFFVQITCAVPLDKIYDLLDGKKKSVLNTGDTYELSEYETVLTGTAAEEAKKRQLTDDEITEYQMTGDVSFQKKERPKRDKEVYTFLLLLAQAFRDSHDPKQFMPIMPRTSLGKIFMMLDEEQRSSILEILEVTGQDSTALPAIGNVTKVKFDDYKKYLLKLQHGLAITEDDLIAKHPEPLGIGKLMDQTETDLSGQGEFPIFEFRRIGRCTLGELPKFLGRLNDEIIRVLDTVPDNS